MSDNVNSRTVETLSLTEFIAGAWDVIEPGTTYLDNWHIDLIAEYLQAITDGDIRRLIINIPPRYMKSLLVSVMWPTWTWTTRPETRWMFSSYSASLSTMHSVLRRLLIQSPWYQERWGNQFSLLGDQNQKTEFTTDKLGMMIATSVGGTSIGKGGDYLVMDDPHNPTQADSDVQREAANQWFAKSFSTRLNDKKHGSMLVVMQRLHERDLTGVLLEQGGWEHLEIQGEAEERTVYSFPKSGREHVREQGAILWPEREGPIELAAQKVALGSFDFAGQYQQRPAPATGGLFKRAWWRFWYDPELGVPAPITAPKADESGEMIACAQIPLPADMESVCQSWDLNFGDAEGKDAADVAGHVWSSRMADCFLLDRDCRRLDFVQSVAAILAMTEKWPQAMAKLIEKKANGAAMISLLGRRVSGMIPVDPQGDKEQRARGVTPSIEAGNVYLPHPHQYPWVWEFLERVSKFPRGARRDDVDAMTQALNRMITYDWGALAEQMQPAPLTEDEEWDAISEAIGRGEIYQGDR